MEDITDRVKGGRRSTILANSNHSDQQLQSSTSATPVERNANSACEACRKNHVFCTHFKRQGSTGTVPPDEQFDQNESARSRKRQRLGEKETERPSKKQRMTRGYLTFAQLLNPQVHNVPSNLRSEAVSDNPSGTAVTNALRTTVEAGSRDEQFQNMQTKIVTDAGASQGPKLRDTPDADFEDKNKELARLREQLTQRDGQISKLRYDLKMQVGHLSKQGDLLQENIAKQQDTIQKQLYQLAGQGAIIRQAQEQKQRGLQDTRPSRISDENMRSKLETLASAVQSFSTNNAIESRRALSATTVFHQRLDEAEPILKNEAWIALAAPDSPRILLEASLNWSICRSNLLIPFNFLDGMRDGAQRDTATPLYRMRGQLETAYGIDCPRVNAVRSEIMSLFHPDENTRPSNLIENLKDSVSTAKEKACDSITACLTGNLGPLLKSGPQAENELLKIVKDALEIAVELGIQKSQILLYGIQHLPDTFDHTSEMMEAHQMYEHPQALDGRRILIVTYPAILALGNSDGSGYSMNKRVLKKAVVWVG